MSGAKGGPDLRRYMDKKLALRLNAGRRVTGTLRGFDQFMNLVLDETIEEVSASERNEIGMVVIRGNSVTMIECLERTVDSLESGNLNCCESLYNLHVAFATQCSEDSPLWWRFADLRHESWH